LNLRHKVVKLNHCRGAANGEEVNRLMQNWTWKGIQYTFISSQKESQIEMIMKVKGDVWHCAW